MVKNIEGRGNVNILMEELQGIMTLMANDISENEIIMVTIFHMQFSCTKANVHGGKRLSFA